MARPMHGIAMQPCLLDLHEVSQILHVSRSWVYQLIHSRQIASVRLGRALRVHPRDLEAYIRRNRLPCEFDLKEFLARHPEST